MLRDDDNDLSGSDRNGMRAHTGDGCLTLDRLRAGEHVEVVSVNDDRARVQALRFGLCQGARISCVTKIPAGPVVVRHGRQEIAVGRDLARRISVKRCLERSKKVN